MKKTIIILSFLLSSFVFEKANAQIHWGLNVNIGTQPAWGPTGYDHVEYYYMPDIDAYYSVSNQQYIYLEGGRWTFASNLPSRFHYDVNNGYKVVVNEPRPYRHAEMYRNKYASFKGRHDQEMIRNSHDSKYFVNKGHPEHERWSRENHDHNDRH